MLQLGNFSACITVDDVELPEYSVTYSTDGKKATCWVPSEEGKAFSVKWINALPSFSTSGRVSIDGVNCGKSKRKFKHDHLQSQPAVSHRKSFRTSLTTVRLFTFSRIELTDDDAYLDTPTSPKLGDIELDIEEVVLGNKRKPFLKNIPEPSKVHERSKKALGHRFTLGAEVVSRKTYAYDHTVVRHVCTFIFKYRPLEILQANGIAPLPKGGSQATPTEDNAINEGGNESDTCQRIQALEAELRSLKRERANRSKRIKTEVKAEPEAFSHARAQIGEVIDLT